MAWDFETEPEFQAQLDWMDDFVREEVEPLDRLQLHPADVGNPLYRKLVRPLLARVK